jgi:hypothetical protein
VGGAGFGQNFGKSYAPTSSALAPRRTPHARGVGGPDYMLGFCDFLFLFSLILFLCLFYFIFYFVSFFL